MLQTREVAKEKIGSVTIGYLLRLSCYYHSTYDYSVPLHSFLNHISSFYRDIMVSGDLVRLSSDTARSNICLMAIYCAALMCRWEICPPILSIPAYDSTSTIGGYSQRLFQNQLIRPEIHCDNQLWRLFSACIIRGVITYNSDPKRITDQTNTK